MQKIIYYSIIVVMIIGFILALKCSWDMQKGFEKLPARERLTGSRKVIYIKLESIENKIDMLLKEKQLCVEN